MAKKNYYKILEIDEKASRMDVESAYKELVDIYGFKSQGTYSLFDDEERDRLLIEIEEAYDTLSDDLKRRQYDENVYIFSNYKTNRTLQKPADKNEHSDTPEITDPRSSVCDFLEEWVKTVDGNFMVELRNRADFTQKDICQLSKMNSNVIEMLESNDFKKLPGRTYVLGFAKLYFRIFTDDYEKFAKAYIENYDISMQSRGK